MNAAKSARTAVKEWNARTPTVPSVKAVAVYASDPESFGERAVHSLYQAIAEQERLEAERIEAEEIAKVARESVRTRTMSPTTAYYGDTVWDALAQCESGGDWSYNGPSGYDGGLQFLPSTWVAAGGLEYAPEAWMASREQQIAVASNLSWSAWPACSQKLGLR